MRKIICNKAQCLLCGDVIESKFTHDYVSCSCHNLSVDGGRSYLRRSIKQPTTEPQWIELSERVWEDDPEGTRN
jgi:hypothetical protein